MAGSFLKRSGKRQWPLEPSAAPSGRSPRTKTSPRTITEFHSASNAIGTAFSFTSTAHTLTTHGSGTLRRLYARQREIGFAYCRNGRAADCEARCTTRAAAATGTPGRDARRAGEPEVLRARRDPRA